MDNHFRETINPEPYTQFAFAFQNSPGKFPAHWHTSAEFIMATRDNSSYRVNGTLYTLNASEMLLVWPTELHEVVSAPEASSVIIQFTPDLITNCMDFNIYYHRLRDIHSPKALSPELNDRICRQVKQIKACLSNAKPLAEPKTIIHIYEILIILCDYLQQDSSHPDVTDSFSHTLHMIKKACCYIDSHCDQNICQKEVAAYCGFSPYYFSRIFREFTHESFPEYLTKKRITAAARLLMSETLPITDVAYQSGFQSISNFNKVFKKFTGCTPVQYRSLHSK